MYDRISELYTVYALPIVQCHAMFVFLNVHIQWAKWENNLIACATCAQLKHHPIWLSYRQKCSLIIQFWNLYRPIPMVCRYYRASLVFLLGWSRKVDVLIKVQRKQSWGINHDGHWSVCSGEETRNSANVNIRPVRSDEETKRSSIECMKHKWHFVTFSQWFSAVWLALL